MANFEKYLESADLSIKNLSREQKEHYLVFIKQQKEFYKEENARMEKVFMKLQLMNNELKLSSAFSDPLSNLKDISENTSGVLSSNSTILSYIDKFGKQNNYTSKLKTYISLYMNLNDQLIKDIKFLRCEHDQAKALLEGPVSKEIFELLEATMTKYEKEKQEYEQKYSWLNDPELILPDITKEMDKFKNLMEIKKNLLKELSVYSDLKPDIQAATQQLAEIEELNKQFENIE